MNWNFWRNGKKVAPIAISREDKLNELAFQVKSMNDEDRLMFFHRVYGNDKHLHRNPPKGIPKKRKEVLQNVE